jgi:hypothetical protein
VEFWQKSFVSNTLAYLLQSVVLIKKFLVSNTLASLLISVVLTKKTKTLAYLLQSVVYTKKVFGFKRSSLFAPKCSFDEKKVLCPWFQLTGWVDLKHEDFQSKSLFSFLAPKFFAKRHFAELQNSRVVRTELLSRINQIY